MGESITEVQIGQIFKQSGSSVKTDDEILELETDKVNQVLNAPSSGIVNLKVKTGDRLKIGDIVGTITPDNGKSEPQKTEETPKTQEAKKEEKPAVETPKKEEKKAEVEEPKKELPPVQTGEHRIARESFVQAPTKKEEQKTGNRRRMSMIRQTIARRLVEAKSETAMLTTFNEIDMTEIIAIREKYKETFQKKFGVKLGFLSFFAKAATSALKTFPLVNSRIEGDEIVESPSIDIGFAVSTERGLVVPVVRDIENLSFSEIEKAIEGFAKKAREGGISVDDLKGGTFTITNGGTFGSLLSTPILNFPQSAILGLHKIEKRAVVIDDQIVIRSMMYVALTYDHRIIDGKEAVQFLVHIKNLLEDPSRFVIDV
jgi:2-oxoglutarate dehydrogenase E2 component (dihydrolipoamide succinyltransferase)